MSRLDKSVALALGHGDVLYHSTLRNADGSPLRARVNGRVQVWKTRPGDFRLPLKHGLYDYTQVTQVSCSQWFTKEVEAHLCWDVHARGDGRCKMALCSYFMEETR